MTKLFALFGVYIGEGGEAYEENDSISLIIDTPIGFSLELYYMSDDGILYEPYTK